MGKTSDISAQKLNDYLYRDDPEPHRARNTAIRKAHPEVKKLEGPEPLTKWVVLGTVTVHVTLAILCRNLSWPWFLLATYAISGTFQANLFLAIHEVTHNLAFSDYKKSRLLAMVPAPPRPLSPPHSLFACRSGGKYAAGDPLLHHLQAVPPRP